MQTVKVRLRKPRRVFTFLCNDLHLERDQPCLVQSDRGTEWGVCVLPPEPCPPEMERRYSMRVLRKVSWRDEETLEWMVTEEAKAVSICAKEIEKHKLPMKLVDAEYTFDKRKIIFYFTADDRVDFRELVRDLAHHLRTRIELRHIQVRDEAKMVGGIGGCGRELCCTTWLNDFKPISMRMAKRQNLSLNPSKISGQCGRLLCCLAYENDQYESAKRQMSRRKEQDAIESKGGPSEGGGRGDRTEKRGRGGDRPPRPDRADRPRRERPPKREDAATENKANAAPRAEGDQKPEDAPRKRNGRRRGRGRKRGGGQGGDASGKQQGN